MQLQQGLGNSLSVGEASERRDRQSLLSTFSECSLLKAEVTTT